MWIEIPRDLILSSLLFDIHMKPQGEVTQQHWLYCINMLLTLSQHNEHPHRTDVAPARDKHLDEKQLAEVQPREDGSRVNGKMVMI